jgi:hypothetical protein
VIVYVETNFVFELATGRDKNDSCALLLEWCRQQRIALRIPAYALPETRTALRRRASIQDGVARDLEYQYRDLDRMRSPDVADLYRTSAKELKSTASNERNRLEAVSKELLRTAELVPLDREIIRLSERFRALEVLTGDADLLIFASVMRDLEQRKTAGDTSPSLFITGDADFGNVRKWLKPYTCDLLTSYSAAVARLKGQNL